MARERYAGCVLSDQPTESFATAEDAWLWFIRCRLAREEGARFGAGRGDVARPCEPDDIAREVGRLYRGRILRPAHLKVLDIFGRRLTPPDPWSGDSPVDARLWDEALDRLSTPLKRKGIVS
ncbi:hypothetical protein [Magnetospirillum molischianum]|uniref:Uncharacterized protein n=1 Tax=Magnetospirillum molischianum DSM 120 TaxID=1150626 RepID=H8FUD8_MAGML|nr:hypothetical protein [Magnetospirillum molischianum]CCG41976.1 conserved hypothetical protein [Magnetospirillum molischianum DSM 120]